MFSHSASYPATGKKKLIATMSGSQYKNVERALGVFQAKWKITVLPARMWSDDYMAVIMRFCVILHNVMVKGRDKYIGDGGTGKYGELSDVLSSTCMTMWFELHKSLRNRVSMPCARSLAALCL